MMRWIVALPLIIVGGILVSPTPVRTQADVAQLPVSIERIRAALNQPPPVLRGPAPARDIATFRLEVQAPVLLPIDEEPFDPTYGLPSVGQLMIGGIDKIRSAVVNHKRRRAERRVRKEVDDALAAFCAAGGCPSSRPRK